MDAPSKEAVWALHDEAHGDIPNEIIEVDLNLVEAFLGRIEDPKPVDPNADYVAVDSAFRAIMFTDLVDSTQIMTNMGDEEAVYRLRIHNAITRNAIKKHNGTEVKHTGDGFMVSFPGISDSAECAITIQRGFAKYNHENPDAGMRLRIGISAGEPIEQNEDLFGTSVNMAARICNHATPNQILAASVIRDICLGKSLEFSDREEVLFKGFDHTVRLYEIRW